MLAVLFNSLNITSFQNNVVLALGLTQIIDNVSLKLRQVMCDV